MAKTWRCTARLRLMIGCLLAFSSVPAGAEEPLTSAQLKAMPLREANRIVRRDLLSIFEPAKRIGASNRQQVEKVELTTRSVGTEFEGVCRRDLVRLEYAPEKTGDLTGDVPIRPYGMRAWNTFHIIRLPPTEKRVKDGRRLALWQPECTDFERKWRQDPNRDPLDPSGEPEWFPAPDAFQAVRAASMLDMALTAVKAGTLKSQPCEHVVTDDTPSCEAGILKAGGLEDISEVRVCPAAEGAICYEIAFFLSGTELTIVAHADDQGLTPQDIESIGVKSFVLLDY